jgi:hypothetical protein
MNQSGKFGEHLWKSFLENRGYDVEEAPPRKFYDWDLKATKREPDPETNFHLTCTLNIAIVQKTRTPV